MNIITRVLTLLKLIVFLNSTQSGKFFHGSCNIAADALLASRGSSCWRRPSKEATCQGGVIFLCTVLFQDLSEKLSEKELEFRRLSQEQVDNFTLDINTAYARLRGIEQAVQSEYCTLG